MKKYIILLIFFMSFIFLTKISYSQNSDTTFTIQTDSNKTKLIEIPQSTIYTILYTKRSVPDIDKPNYTFDKDGNNFYGFSICNDIHLSRLLSLLSDEQLQLGNINGKFAIYFGLIPKIMLGEKYYRFYFGSGPSLLAIDENNNKNGGFGMAASFGGDINVYKGLGINLNLGFEDYANTKYFSIGLGINFRIHSN